MVFFVDSMISQCLHFLLLDLLQLVTVVLNLLALTLTLLQMVVLRLHSVLVILGHLFLDADFVLESGLLLFSFHSSLGFLVLFLALNQTQEFHTLLLSLMSQSFLFIAELTGAGRLQVGLDVIFLLSFGFILGTSFSVKLFTSAFSFQIINFCLSVGSLLLEVTQTLQLLLFLGSETSGLTSFLLLNSVLGLLVIDDLLFEVLLVLTSFGFNLDGLFVGSFNFLKKLFDIIGFSLFLTEFLSFLLLDISEELLFLFVKNVLVTETFLFSLLDLVNDLKSTSPSSDFALSFTILLCLQVLEPLNFHHGVKTRLLLRPLFLEPFVFVKLLITDSDNLAVQHH